MGGIDNGRFLCYHVPMIKKRLIHTQIRAAAAAAQTAGLALCAA
jgi:hypothetical protein